MASYHLAALIIYVGDWEFTLMNPKALLGGARQLRCARLPCYVLISWRRWLCVVGVGPTQNIFSFPAAIAVDRSGNVFVVTETYASRRRNKNPLVLIELSEISLKISLENITFASNLVSDRRSAAKN